MENREEIAAYVDEVWEDVVSDIAELVAIDSVENLELAEPGKPWGPNVAAALDAALGIARKLGLKTTNLDGYIGWGELAGESDKTLATIAHVDIVPAATGWATDPFEVVRREGYLLGRGVIDDKGPLVLSLYAAHYFARKGVKPAHTIRCIVGANEETGMGDVEHYLEAKGEPDFLFTPDAQFPVCCGEKGVYHAKLVSQPVFGEKLAALDAGIAANAIPATAEAVLNVDAAGLPAEDGISVEDLGADMSRVTATGVGGHASIPEGTKSALGMLVNYLVNNRLVSDAELKPLTFLQKVHAAYDGSALGIDATDDIFEPLTIINGTAHIDEGVLTATLDSRYPKSTTGERITATLEPQAEAAGLELVDVDDTVPFYIDPSSAEIETLVKTYNDHTGEESVAFTIGGGTYARHFQRAASFGPELADENAPEWVGCMHGGNEGVSEAQLRFALNVYIDAIARLLELELV